jgi:hypothetical protein
MRHLLLALCIAFGATLQAQEPLKLKVDLEEITATEKVYNFISENFVGVIGWQFTMEFDGTKMKFKEIRNAVNPAHTSHNFNEPVPGELRSVWIDTDLQSNDYPDSTVLFQLVFEILEAEGAPLCFLESQEFFEFILDEDMPGFEFAELLISDDCYQGFSIILETTATDNPSANVAELVKEVFIASKGTIAFTSNLDQELRISLLDMSGKVISSFVKKEYGEGRHTLNCKGMVPGVYVLRFIAKDGKECVVKVIAN